MDLQTFDQLLTPDGQTLLDRATQLPDLRDDTLLRDLTAFRRTAPPALATAALETVLLRRRAQTKFSRAEAMYFTRDALEQASAEVIARYRARKFAGYESVADLGCGIGGDTIALAAVVGRVVAVDRDPLRLAMARANARAYGVDENIRLTEADLRETGPAGCSSAFFDPARRTVEGKRLFSIDAYEPPLSIVREWLPATPAIGVKISPGVNLAQIAALGLDCEVEFLSVSGDLREAALWFGPLCSAIRRATLLPGGHTLTDTAAPPLAVAPPGRYILEPDPAIYRAGLLDVLAAQLSAWQIDPTIAYLSADTFPDSPFVRAWPVETTLPFSLKAVRRYLREHEVGPVVVKKRGSPIDPQDFERMLRLTGPECRTVFLTRAAGKPVAIVARESATTRPSPS